MRDEANKLKQHLLSAGVEHDIAEFVAEIESRRMDRGGKPLDLCKVPIEHVRREAGECLAVALDIVLNQQAALASTAAAMTENAKLKKALAASEAERRPSAVAKAPAVVQTHYWDPYNAGDGDY